jgi:hypothetical protein
MPGPVGAREVIAELILQLGDLLPQPGHRFLDADDKFAQFGFGLLGHAGSGLCEATQHLADRRLHFRAGLREVTHQTGPAVPPRGDLAAQPRHVIG